MTSIFDLSGRAALVTGAGSEDGIGFATARMLTELGASVLITSTTERIHDRAAQLKDTGADVASHVGDLTEPDTATELVALALGRWGHLEVVVQNAGMTTVADAELAPESLLTVDYVKWRASLARNLDTCFYVAKACLPAMTGARWGRLIMVSSVTGPVMAMRDEPAYAAAKAGVVGLTRALAVDSAACGVTVNVVAPGWIATGSQTAHEYAQGLATPMGRSALPDEVASAICWLASPGASYVTGQCLVVDGGNSIAEERT